MLEHNGNRTLVRGDDGVDEFEQTARIVEAFAEGESGETLDLLIDIARAIRDRAFVE